LNDILDKEILLERVQGDEELAKELLEMFVEDVPGRLVKISQACESGDMKTIALEAHTIKGAAGNVAANDIHAAALQVELAGKDNNTETIPSLIQQLEKHFEVFQQAVAGIDF